DVLDASRWANAPPRARRVNHPRYGRSRTSRGSMRTSNRAPGRGLEKRAAARDETGPPALRPLQDKQRVDADIEPVHPPMQMRPRRPPGGPHRADHLAL